MTIGAFLPGEPTGIRRLVHACDLPAVWRSAERFTLMELGWSNALLFLHIWQAWRHQTDRPRRVRYVAMLPGNTTKPGDSHPHQAKGLAHWTANHALPDRTILQREGIDPALEAALRARWPLPIEGVHRIELEDGHLQLTLAFGDPAHMLPGLLTQIDLLLAAPDTPAGLRMTSANAAPRPDGQDLAGFTPAVLRRAGRLLTRAGRAVIDTQDTLWVSTLRAAGLAVSLTQPDGLVVLRPIASHTAPAVQQAPATEPPCAVVIGAGLAGSAIAFALARRGWSVEVLEGEPFAHSGSAQPMLAQHPSATLDDALLSRLTRAALALSQGAYESDAMRRIGRLQCCDDVQAMALAQGWPDALMRAVSAPEAATLSGLPGIGPGLWWPQVGCADPQALRESWDHHRARRRLGLIAASLRRARDQWQVCDANGQVIAEAPEVVIAAGAGSLDIRVGPLGWEGTSGSSGADKPAAAGRLGDALGTVGWQVRRARSTLARIAAPSMPACIIGGSGHAVPLDAHHLLLGPARDEPTPDAPSTEHDALSAWTRHASQVHDNAPPLALRSARLGERLSSRDHLPLIGAVPDLQAVHAQRIAMARNDRLPMPCLAGLWMATGFGGRGLLWAVLAAELLAARLEHEPLPITHDLVTAIDPARFLRRSLRQSSASLS
jgi:tRNA 5-methylaminomethyl-2-thiouridine biosynthesis bifunctional protein